MPAEKRETIFEPFYTTKAEGEGTGLGLALSRGIIAAHRGRILVEDSSLGGARFVVALPAVAGSTPAAGIDPQHIPHPRDVGAELIAERGVHP